LFQSEYGSQIPLSIILIQVQLEAVLWGMGTAIGELPPYFISRAGIMIILQYCMTRIYLNLTKSFLNWHKNLALLRLRKICLPCELSTYIMASSLFLYFHITMMASKLCNLSHFVECFLGKNRKRKGLECFRQTNLFQYCRL
jgi:hypothetical protein